MMIDFAGKKMFYIDPGTGERIDVEVFVAVLTFCGLIFWTAVHSQQTPDFTTCINEMLLFYRGVAATIICDDFKTAVIRPSKYEPKPSLQLSKRIFCTAAKCVVSPA